MLFDDPLHRCQPDTVSFELTVVMQPAERFEQLAGERHIETCSVVSDKKDSSPGLTGLAYLDHRCGNLGSVFERIVEKVLQADAQHGAISLHDKIPGYGKVYRPISGLFLKLIQNLQR